MSSSSQKLPSWWLSHEFLHKSVQGIHPPWTRNLPIGDWVGSLEALQARPSATSEEPLIKYQSLNSFTKQGRQRRNFLISNFFSFETYDMDVSLEMLWSNKAVFTVTSYLRDGHGSTGMSEWGIGVVFICSSNTYLWNNHVTGTVSGRQDTAMTG